MKLYKICNKISLLLHALCSAAGYFLIEAISRHSFVEAWNYMTGKPLVFAYNAGLIFVTSLIAYLFRRRTFWRVLIAIFWLLLGITNGVILANRVTPFTGPDLHLLTDGMAILNKYLPAWGVIIALIVLGLFVLILLALLIRGPKYKRRVKFRYDLLMVVVAVAAFAGITQLALDKRVLSNYFGNIAFAYEDYGYPYCLAVTIFDTGISCPRDYSEKEIRRIEKTEENLPATSDSSKPNILFLQLESFFDPTLVNYLKISEDPIPNFRKLMKEYSSGYLTVPAVGAGTANVEFEVMTGISAKFFGPGEYPYKSVLTEKTCEAAPYDFKQLGYGTHAIHNHRGAFYNRNKVFANMGFDTFTCLEYMNNVMKTPKNWAKDSLLTEQILDALNSTEGSDYIYTISVQGHGKYPTEQVIENPAITVTQYQTEEQRWAYEYYANQIYEMDLFVKELTDTLNNYDEDVILVMYGDHLPALDMTEDSMADGSSIFQTQYIVWSNFDMKKKNMDINAYELNSEIMSRLGMSVGMMNKYQQNYKDDINYKQNLEALSYDMLYGKRYIYGETNPFKKTDLKMGVKDIKVTDVVKIGENYYIKGENFTEFSKVSLDGKILKTVYLGPTILALKEEVDPEDASRMKVSQVEKNKEILSTTE